MDDKTQVNKNWSKFYPWVHISWSITSPAQSAIYHKHVILIGAGSGIAPYLSFIDDYEENSS